MDVDDKAIKQLTETAAKALRRTSTSTLAPGATTGVPAATFGFVDAAGTFFPGLVAAAGGPWMLAGAVLLAGALLVGVVAAVYNYRYGGLTPEQTQVLADMTRQGIPTDENHAALMEVMNRIRELESRGQSTNNPSPSDSRYEVSQPQGTLKTSEYVDPTSLPKPRPSEPAAAPNPRYEVNTSQGAVTEERIDNAGNQGPMRFVGTWKGSMCGVEMAELRITAAGEELRGTILNRPHRYDNGPTPDTSGPPRLSCNDSRTMNHIRSQELDDDEFQTVTASERALDFTYGAFTWGTLRNPGYRVHLQISGDLMKGVMTEYPGVQVTFERTR